MWDSVRDAFLQAYPWNFAIKRAQVAADGATATYATHGEYTKRYLLPSDFLSLLSIRNSPIYQLEGQYILTNEGAPLKFRYISRITNTGEHDAMFTEAFASKLAFEAIEEFTASNTKKQVLAQQLEIDIKAAFASDAIQDQPQDIETDEWLLARESSVRDDIDYNL